MSNTVRDDSAARRTIQHSFRGPHQEHDWSLECTLPGPGPMDGLVDAVRGLREVVADRLAVPVAAEKAEGRGKTGGDEDG